MKKIIIVLLLVLLPAAAYAAGLFTREIPSTVTVIEVPQANLKIYSNAATTTEITSIDWGMVMKGNTATRQVWVKNIGEVDFASVNAASDLPVATGTLSGAPNGYSLAVGGKQAVTLSLQIAATAPSGGNNFILRFEGGY